MTASTSSGFDVHAIAPQALREIRDRGVDLAGVPVHNLITEGGEPLRCCLRDARPRERAMLFGYEPALPRSPYRETGAVYAHAGDCAGPPSRMAYPPQWRGRAQVLRAYDSRGWIHGATRVHDGHNPEVAIAQVLAHPDVAFLHSRNVAWGCYMFAITRCGAAH